MNTLLSRSVVAALAAMGTTVILSAPLPSSAAAPDPLPLVCNNTADTPATGTYASVTVPAGATCYLVGAHVIENVRAFNPESVYIIDTTVDHNILVQGAAQDVVIGTSGCGVDPLVGNNIRVLDSHNVAICQEQVNNNIKVKRNDGRIALRWNTAGENIMVTHNYAYVPLPNDGQHPLIDSIRVKHNTAGRHIFVRYNDGRPLILVDNSPTPITA